MSPPPRPRVSKQCNPPEFSKVHNQDHLSEEQQNNKAKIQTKTTKHNDTGNERSKTMKNQRTFTPSLIKKFNICKFKNCVFLANSRYRCKYHDTFKKCMFPKCYNEKQKNSGKCKKHIHFKQCKKKRCYIYDGNKGDYCRIHTS